jgi:hypothetical protein
MLNTRDSDGIIFPKRYMNLSDVITRLNDTNHKSIVTSITPDEMPYKILSRVRGLPLLKYIRIVCPSWLNAGLIKAVTRMDGRQNFSINMTLFLPSVLIMKAYGRYIEHLFHPRGVPPDLGKLHD